jgi:hypothetical protein
MRNHDDREQNDAPTRTEFVRTAAPNGGTARSPTDGSATLRDRVDQSIRGNSGHWSTHVADPCFASRGILGDLQAGSGRAVGEIDLFLPVPGVRSMVARGLALRAGGMPDD